MASKQISSCGHCDITAWKTVGLVSYSHVNLSYLTNTGDISQFQQLQRLTACRIEERKGCSLKGYRTRDAGQQTSTSMVQQVVEEPSMQLRFVQQQSSRSALFGGLLEVGDEVIPVLVLLQAAEGHLGAGDVLLGVLEVGELLAVLAKMSKI